MDTEAPVDRLQRLRVVVGHGNAAQHDEAAPVLDLLPEFIDAGGQRRQRKTLLAEHEGLRAPGLYRFDGGIQLGQLGRRETIDPGLVRRDLAASPGGEIGRASVRERVCPYV